MAGSVPEKVPKRKKTALKKLFQDGIEADSAILGMLLPLRRMCVPLLLRPYVGGFADVDPCVEYHRAVRSVGILDLFQQQVSRRFADQVEGLGHGTYA